MRCKLYTDFGMPEKQSNIDMLFRKYEQKALLRIASACGAVGGTIFSFDGATTLQEGIQEGSTPKIIFGGVKTVGGIATLAVGGIGFTVAENLSDTTDGTSPQNPDQQNHPPMPPSGS